MPEHEPLFDELLEKLHQFNTLGDQALKGELSKIGEEDKQDGTLHRSQQYFKGVLEDSKQQTSKIKNLLPDFPDNKQEMSRPLAFYRSIGKYYGDSPPAWSVYLDDLDNILDEAVIIIGKLDRKYLMGYFDHFSRYVQYHVDQAGMEPPTHDEILQLDQDERNAEDRDAWEPVSALKKLRQQNQS